MGSTGKGFYRKGHYQKGNSHSAKIMSDFVMSDCIAEIRHHKIRHQTPHFYYICGMKKIVFITGATSGFGKACALLFAANKYNVIINGRRAGRLQELKQELENQFGIEALP